MPDMGHVEDPMIKEQTSVPNQVAEWYGDRFPMTQAQQNNDYCFGTLALGERYCLLAKQLARDLEQFTDRPLLVLTDNVHHFSGMNNVIAIFHRKRSVRGYNDKLCVFRKALHSFNTCIMLDADMRILAPITLTEEVFQPGITAYRVRSWEYTVEEANSGPPAQWRTENLRIMKLLRRELALQQPDAEIPFVVEFLFSITRTHNTEEFLRTWNRIAEFCERNGFFIHVGFSIGLAALLDRVPISKHGFEGLMFFEPLVSRQDHVPAGIMSQAQYDSLCQSIKGLKYSASPSRVRRALSTMFLLLNYYQVKLWGLNLFDF